ncbi:patatin-like phospholipase family protein [Candidatus Cloacimonadota bacterium]
MKKIGLSLGGGGARGLCHIEFLKVFDEFGIKPHVISGTSIGAIIGAFYASGLSGNEIQKILEKIDISHPIQKIKTTKNQKDEMKMEKYIEQKFLEFKKYLNKIDMINKMIDVSFFKNTSFLHGKGVENFFEENLPVKSFEELTIPLKIVATDYWHQKQVVFSSGGLVPAIRASMSIPAVFEPVIIDNKVMIDGGITNNLPYDIIQEECDITIAINVSGNISIPSEPKAPNLFDNIMISFDILQDSIIEYQMKMKQPDIYIKPDLLDIGLLEFHKADEIIESVQKEVDQFRHEMREILKPKKKIFGIF